MTSGSWELLGLCQSSDAYVWNEVLGQEYTMVVPETFLFTRGPALNLVEQRMVAEREVVCHCFK